MQVKFIFIFPLTSTFIYHGYRMNMNLSSDEDEYRALGLDVRYHENGKIDVIQLGTYLALILENMKMIIYEHAYAYTYAYVNMS